MEALQKSADFRRIDCRKGNANRLAGPRVIALSARLLSRGAIPTFLASPHRTSNEREARGLPSKSWRRQDIERISRRPTASATATASAKNPVAISGVTDCFKACRA
jgi:hypothetical protein